MKTFRNAVFLATLAVSLAAAHAQSSTSTASAPAQANILQVAAKEASKHIGEVVTVYGVASNVELTRGGRYRMETIIDVDGNYPNQPFNIVQMFSDSVSFSKLKHYQGKKIWVTGLINKGHGIPTIFIKSADEISLTGQAVLPATIPVWAQQESAAVQLQTNQPLLSTSSNTNKHSIWWLAVADTGSTNNIETLTGKIYHHAKVTRVEPDGLTIKYMIDGGGIGGIKIPFENLSAEYQQEYGFDSQKADAYVKAKKDAELQQKVEQAAREQAELDAEAKMEQALADLEKQQHDEDIKIQTLQAQQTRRAIMR